VLDPDKQVQENIRHLFEMFKGSSANLVQLRSRSG
jgi:hypothetical protein